MHVLIVAAVLGLAQATNWTDPVNTSKGQIRGLYAEDGDYSMYLGIPFGQVEPKNPFGISTPYPNFDTVFDAIDDSATCPQDGFGPTTLDCLHLNVYVPANAQTKLPVLIWIYGGGFTSGLASRLFYGPKFLVRHDVIFVSLNYRVGPYGFMCLDTEEVPGNQGLRDQYLALQWIYENIAAFGGDVSKMTVMGESAGSMSIDLHLLSKLPKFYNQAILQSGTGLTPMVVIPSDNTVPVRIANHLGHTTDNMKDALSFLATAPTQSVITATTTLGIPLTLCVEKEFPNVDRFISVHPELDDNSEVSNMPIMAGFTSHEQLTLHASPAQMYTGIFHEHLHQQYSTDNMTGMVDTVRRFYIGDEEFDENIMDDIVDFSSDFIFNFPVQRSVLKYIEAGAQVYQYMFSYDGGRNYLKRILNIEKEGAAHADELGYLFDMLFLWETPSVQDQLIIDRMTTMWTDFVKHGNPTPTTSELIPVTWPRATKEVVSYLDIDSTLTVGARPYHNRMIFWDLFLAANRDYLWAILNSRSSSIRLSATALNYFPILFIIYVLKQYFIYFIYFYITKF